MKEQNVGKVLEEGESTFQNGDGGAICGGVINQSLFDSDPWAFMMAWVMPDDKFADYKALKQAGKDEEATKLFEKFAVSMI